MSGEGREGEREVMEGEMAGRGQYVWRSSITISSNSYTGMNEWKEEKEGNGWLWKKE